MENILHKIETETAEFINKLRLGEYSILHDSKKLLLRFTSLQSVRTSLSKTNSLDQAKTIVSSYIKKIIIEKFGEQDNEDYGTFTFEKEFERELISNVEI